jgi:predicted alpha/beta hydrolase
MTADASTGHLSGEEILALRFAVHRQLARWAKNPRLSADQHARRNALKRAVDALHDPAFAHGCDLYAPAAGGQR